MTDKSKKAIVDGAAIGYTAGVILLLVEESDLAELTAQSKDSASEFWGLYKKAEAKSRFIIDQKLLEMAQSGDLKAIEKLELRRRSWSAK